MSDEVTIKIRDNGPYIVRGSVVLMDSEGKAYQTQEVIALCRCGHSPTKPFCDGTHKTAGFESAPRA
jgi:CDGSH-type Zn-finger protein